MIKVFCVITIITAIVTALELRGQQYELPSCPDEFMPCYNTCLFPSNQTASWYDAPHLCRENHNSNLLSLRSKQKDTNIRKCLQKLQFADELWIDGVFDARLNRWIWGRTAEALYYQAFSRKEVDDDSEWRCIALNRTLLYRWSAKNCISKKNFVCELEIK